MLSLQSNYKVHPEIFIFLPVALCLLIASYLVPKHL